ncbi:MAG: hypothetical protein K8S62_11075, partial [Candidatus Sabulitectum sp.]|nr:hypothetical protein [Candidatus Sabulitectum sp.]
AYFTSPANVLFNMGLLACTGIITALVADFTVTPILLKMAKVYGDEERTGRSKLKGDMQFEMGADINITG